MLIINREELRRLKRLAKEKIAKAKAYILISFDGKKVEYIADISKLIDKEDIRHRALRAMYQENTMLVEGINTAYQVELAKKNQAEKAKEFKEKRSEELQKEK